MQSLSSCPSLPPTSLFFNKIPNKSKLIKSDNINTLHLIFPGLNFLKNIISSHFVILNHTSNLQFAHSERNGQNFRFLVPDQSINLNLVNLFSQGFQVLFLFVDFHVENHDGFRNYCFFGLCGRGGHLEFFFNFGSSGFVVSKKVDIVVLFFRRYFFGFLYDGFYGFCLRGLGLGSSRAVFVKHRAVRFVRFS